MKKNCSTCRHLEGGSSCIGCWNPDKTERPNWESDGEADGEQELERLRRLAGTGVRPEDTPAEAQRLSTGLSYAELGKQSQVTGETARRFCLAGPRENTTSLKTAVALCRALTRSEQGALQLLARHTGLRGHVAYAETHSGPPAAPGIVLEISRAGGEVHMGWGEHVQELEYLLQRWWRADAQGRLTMEWFLAQDPAALRPGSTIIEHVRTAINISREGGLS